MAKDLEQKKKHNRRLSNSCNLKDKRKDFIKAILDQNQKQAIDPKSNFKPRQENLSSKISETEINLMMSSSSGTGDKNNLVIH